MAENGKCGTVRTPFDEKRGQTLSKHYNSLIAPEGLTPFLRGRFRQNEPGKGPRPRPPATAVCSRLPARAGVPGISFRPGLLTCGQPTTPRLPAGLIVPLSLAGQTARKRAQPWPRGGVS